MNLAEDETLVRYSIKLDENDLSVRLEVTGFETAEDAMAFADWLATLPFEEEDVVVH